MTRSILAALVLLLMPCAAHAGEPAKPPPPAAPAPVEVMVLGTFHFANPGQDHANILVDDMLAPRRQGELDRLAQALARWKPTRVLVEEQSPPPTFAIARYADAVSLLRSDRNETVQIGFRLARLLGHRAVYGFDEQPGPGEPNYFPFDAVMEFAQGHGTAAPIEAALAEVQGAVAAQEAALPQRSVAEALLEHNGPETTAMHDRLYYGVLAVGDGDRQPGADLNAMWYLRNAKMFAKLGLIARPGDRVLVLVGSGHAAWLRHFAEHAPGYRLVEARPYLEAAAAEDIAAPR